MFLSFSFNIDFAINVLLVLAPLQYTGKYCTLLSAQQNASFQIMYNKTANCAFCYFACGYGTIIAFQQLK